MSGEASSGDAATKSAATEAPSWTPIPSKLRRILGVLMEKAKTTPDVYPLSLASLVAGATTGLPLPITMIVISIVGVASFWLLMRK